MITISEIAKEACVSRALVSRVINNKPGVSPKNRKKILSIMEANHYTPNSNALSLATKKTNIIGVVMDNINDHFFSKLINGIQDAGEELGYSVIFCNGRSNMELKLKYLDFLSHGRTDGVLAYGSHMKDESSFYQMIANQNRNFLLVEGNLSNCRINNVLLDNFQGAYNATDHLIGLGYKKIYHFTGDVNCHVSIDRINGYLQAMRSHSLPIKIITADFGEASGYVQMKQLIEDEKVPEAAFFGGDKAAFGAIKALAEAGLRVPEDIAIIGFDDDVPETFDFAYPELSTVQQPLYEMGTTSMKILVNSIENDGAEPEVKIFEPKLVLRDTCR